MKKFLLFILSVFFLLQMGHTQEFRASAVDELSLVYYFSALDGAFNSVATDENHFYLGSWLNNRIAQHNMDGSNGRIFYMNDVYGLRDLTFDGTFFYGVNATMNIYKMNLADDTLVAVIPVTMPDEYELRHISYDPTLDGGNGGFWVGGNNSMGAVSMSGAQLKTLVNFNDVVVGTALDPYSDPQNPFLWLMTQVVDGHAFLRKFDINTQMINTFSHDCQSDLPNIPMYAGGGLFSYFSEGIFRLAVNIQNSPNLVMIYDIIDLTPLGVPAQVPNLTVAAGANGSLNAIINWTNPSLTYNGETLNEITAVKIYEGNTLIHTVTNVTPGQNCTYTASVPTEGSYTYKVVPENSAGTGPSKSVESPWIGHDMPAAPQNPLLTTVDNNISWTVNVSWTAPQTGLHDGYFTNQNLVYDVYRMPAGTLVSSEQTGLTFTETVTELGTYLYKIIAKNHIGTGGSSNTNAVALCRDVEIFPWIEKFSTTTFPPPCWTNNTIAGGADWNLSLSYFSPPHAANHGYADEYQDSWLITPAIALPNEGNFGLEFMSNVLLLGSNYGSSEVWISTQGNNPPTDFTMVKKLVMGVDFTPEVVEWREFFVDLSSYLGETIYIGFRYFSDYNDAYAHSWSIDDVIIRDLPDYEASITKIYGAVSPMVGEPFRYKVLIENTGFFAITDYTLTLKDGDGNVLSTGSNLPTVPFKETVMVDLNWTPQTEGAISLFAEIELNGVPNPPHATSPAFNITIQPSAEVFESKVGTETTIHPWLPFANTVKYSASQCLYFGHEIIDRGGIITQMKYFNTYTPMGAGTQPIKILMANTSQNNLDEWILEEDLTVVFEGDVYFPGGQNAINIELDQSFPYFGDNLAIMVIPVDGVNPAFMKYFLSSKTNEFPNRSRIYNNPYAELNMSLSPGTGISELANAAFSISLSDEMRSVSGIVTSDGTTPVEGVLIEIESTLLKHQTNEDGAYSFNYLTPGEYTFNLSKHGHEDLTSTITIEPGEDLIIDFILPFSELQTVDGTIIGSNTLSGLANVVITLEGYEDYSTTTNEAGYFSISDVYSGHIYNIKAELEGYQTYSSTITVNGNITHNITLNENAYPVFGLYAEIIDDNAEITWNQPNGNSLTTFRYDSGIPNGQVGWATDPGPGTRNSLLGVIHNENAELLSMSWFSTNNVIQNAYDLWILGLDNTGMPDRNNVIFTVQNIPNDPMKWCSYEFPMTICAPNGFFMAVSPSNGGFTSIGTAYATEEYPFIPNKNLGSYAPGEPFECLSLYGFQSNLMIRADGFALGKKAGFGYTENEGKAITNYRVYRLKDGQQNNETQWTLLSADCTTTKYTDANWNSLPKDVYRYAVKAQYTSEVISMPRFTAALGKDMEIYCTINLTTNSGDPVTGAIVTLKNTNGNSAYVYNHTAASGAVIFPKVWRGTYNISVTLDGFYNYSKTIEINPEGLEFSFDVQLEEAILTPYGLLIKETGKMGERLLTWNNTTLKTYTLDDGSMEDGYSFEPGWEVLLGNKFTVGEEGFLTSVDIFGSFNDFVAIFGANKVTIDIYDKNQELIYKSEPVYLIGGTQFGASEWGNYPLNNIPFSDTFYIMVHWYADGFGFTHFLGCDYDGPNANANFDMLVYNNQWDNAHMVFEDAPFVFMIRANADVMGQVKSRAFDTNTANVTGVVNGDFKNAVHRAGNQEPIDAESKYTKPEHTTESSKSFTGYTVFLNDVEVSTVNDTEFLFTDLANGNYTAGVVAVYSSGTTDMRTIDFTVNEVIGVEINDVENIILYPNPFTNEIYINNPEMVKSVAIMDITGEKVKNVSFVGNPISTGDLSSGIYFVVIETITGEKLVYKMVNK